MAFILYTLRDKQERMIMNQELQKIHKNYRDRYDVLTKANISQEIIDDEMELARTDLKKQLAYAFLYRLNWSIDDEDKLSTFTKRWQSTSDFIIDDMRALLLEFKTDADEIMKAERTRMYKISTGLLGNIENALNSPLSKSIAPEIWNLVIRIMEGQENWQDAVKQAF
jgi:hypothetical protein